MEIGLGDGEGAEDRQLRDLLAVALIGGGFGFLLHQYAVILARDATSVRARHAQAVRRVAHVGIVEGAGGGAQRRRLVLPGAAAQDPLAAVLGLASRAVPRRADVILAPAVRDPLLDPARHVVQPEGVRGEAADAQRFL